MAVPATKIGPRDMIRADGSIDCKVLKFLARRRIASQKIEIRDALRHYRSLAHDLYAAHPANKDRVQLHSLAPFGHQVEGVRHSAF